MNSIKTLLISLLIINLIIVSADAETGSFIINSAAGNSYTCPGTEGGNFATSFQSFTFDTADYNFIEKLDLSLDTGTFINDTKSTSFTITSGGIGSGTVIYTKSPKQIIWYFATNSTITSSPFTLTYNSNILLSDIGSIGTCPGTPVTNASAPVYLKNDAGGSSYGHYISQTSKIATATYNTTYFQQSNTQFFNLTVIKDGTTTTKVTAMNSTGTYFTESTFNVNNISVVSPYNSGLSVYYNDSVGNFDFKIINMTGYTGFGIPLSTPTPIATPTINPLTGSGITWDKANYSLNDIAIISYLTDSSLFDYGSTYRIEIHKNNPDKIVKTFDNVGLFGSVNYQLTETGSYTAMFFKWRLFNTLLDQKSVTVAINPSYIFLPSPVVAVGKQFNVSVIYGITPFAQTFANGLYAYKDGELKQFVTAGINISSNTMINLTFSLQEEGNYDLQLKDFSKGVLTQVPLAAAILSVPPTVNISTSYLSLDKSTYYLGDLLTATYGIDNTNYSKGYVYYGIHSYDTGQDQNKDDWQLVNQEGTKEVIFYDTLRTKWSSGNMSFIAKAVNDTSTTEIIRQNFTLSDLNINGYKLKLISNNVSCGEKVTFIVTTPINSTFFINRNDQARMQVGDTGRRIITVKLNSIQQTLNYLLAEGNYYYELQSSDGTAQYIGNFVVRSCAAAKGTPGVGVPSSGAEGAVNFFSNLLGFLAMPAFWGLIILVVAVVTTATNEKASHATGIVAFILANIEAIIGLWSPFTLYIIVITWVIAAIYFTMGRQTVTGVK